MAHWISGKRLLLGTVLSAFVLAAGDPPAVADESEKVLRVIPIGDLRNIDPIWTTAYITRNHGYLVFDTLFSMDENYQPQPQMVDTWEVSEDRLTWTFTLREGLKWHDGAPVTAEDCVASIQRWSKRDGMGQALMGYVEALETMDDRSFRMRLTEPVGFVLEALGKIDSVVPFMMPKRLAETDPFDQIPEVIGSGPFKFMRDEWIPGSKVVYERFEDYMPREEPASLAAGGKVAHFERVEWLYMPDPAVAVAALGSGEVDFMETIAIDLVPVLEANPDVRVETTDPRGAQTILRMNHLHPPFDNPKAREAMLWVVNQEDYMNSAIGDPRRWRTCPAYFVCGTEYELDIGSDVLLAHDPEKAKALLEEAGYDGEPIVVLDPTDSPLLHPLALVTAQLLRSIGANVDLQAMDWSTLTSRRAMKNPPSEGGWHIFNTNAMASGLANPITNVYAGGGCENAWFGWPCDERVEALRKQWGLATDPEERLAIVKELQSALYELVPYVITGQYTDVVAYRADLEGVIKGPAQFYWNIRRSVAN